MNPLELYYLLGKCLAMDDFPVFQGEIREHLSKDGFPWDRFVSTGSHHLVLPALYSKFSGCGMLDALPPDLSDYLKQVFQMNEQRNRGILDQASKINGRLRAAGVNPVFIKGVASLALGIFTHPAERMLWDIDCIIPEAQLREAVQVLNKEGYTHAPYREEDLPFMHHFPTLSHRGGVAVVDLHFRPVAGPYDALLHNWEERTFTSSVQDGSSLETMGPGDQALLNFLHSQVQDHGDYYARVSLKNLYEFYRISSSTGLPSGKAFQGPGLDRKLKHYRALVERTFYPPSGQETSYGLSTRSFLKRFDLNKSSRFYHRVSKNGRQVLFQAAYYLKLLSRAITQRKYRRYIMVRMGDRAWPRSHVSHLRRKFNGSSN